MKDKELIKKRNKIKGKIRLTLCVMMFMILTILQLSSTANFISIIQK